MSMHVARERLMDAVATVVTSATVYSDSVAFRQTTGFAAIRVISTSAGGGTVTITQQCSFDNKNWYEPIDTSGTALGTVYTALAATTGSWIVFSPQMAPYIRFKVVEGGTADVTVFTLDLMFQESNG